jgi:hypothetical protein
MARRRSSYELRCFCRTEPLLAVYGLDEQGKLYLHVKIYKQARVYGEMVVTGGEVKIRCRECLRWHRVIFVDPNRAELAESDEPILKSDNPAAVDACASDRPSVR